MLMKLSANMLQKTRKRQEEKTMKIYKTKLYRVDYKGTHGGGVDHIRGRVILENYPWIVEAAANGEIELTKIN